MKNKNLWILTIVFFLLVYLINTYIKSNDDFPDFPNIEVITNGYIYGDENRKLVIEDSPDNIYEYIVIKYISAKISGDFEDVSDELLLHKDSISINNLRELYAEGYGAKEIVIYVISTYETLDDLKKDEHNSYRLERLDIQNIDFETNKIVFVEFVGN